jgi:hypothetical protein
MNILSGPRWIVRAVVWDEEEWSQVPFEVSEILLTLRRELGKTSGRRFLFELSKRD